MRLKVVPFQRNENGNFKLKMRIKKILIQDPSDVWLKLKELVSSPSPKE